MNEQTQAPPLALSIPQAAEALCVSPRHLRNLIKRGVVPYVKLGDRVVIRRATLDALLQQMEQVSSGKE